MIIELSSDSTKFRFTTIKSYYDDLIDRINLEFDEHVFEFIESLFSFVEFSIENSLLSFNEISSNMFQIDIVSSSTEQDHFESIKRDRDRFRKYFASTAYLSFVFNSDSIVVFAFAFAVVIKLDSILIHIALSQFAVFRQKKTFELIEKDVFQSVNKDDVSSDVRIFNFRFVNEIKHFDIDKTFEKSRLVMQTFNDQNKNLVLTQSLITQRVNQRLIVCLVVVFSKMNLYLRNIIQTYVQSTTSLNKDFFVHSSVELTTHLDVDSNRAILKMMKSLYEIFEIDNH